MTYKTVPLGEVLRQRKGSITIDDSADYKLCRVQLHRKGVVLRQIQKGVEIRTKKQQVCKAGDFIVAEMDAKVGGYGFIPAELDGAIVSSHYYLFEVNESKLLPAYLQVLTQTDYIQSQIKATGSTNYASIRPHEVLELTIPLPSPEEQQIIVEHYQLAKEKTRVIIDELQAQQTLLTKLRQAILQEAVQGKLTAKWRGSSKENQPVTQGVPDSGPVRTATQPETGADLLARIRAEKAELIRQGKLRKEKPLPPITDAEKPFNLPEGWVWCRLGEVKVLSEAGKSFLCNERSCQGEEWGVIKMSAISSGKFIETENKYYRDSLSESLLANKIVEADFLITRASGSPELVGRSVVVSSINKNLLLNDKTIRYVFAHGVESNYINLVNNSDFVRAYYRKTVSATSTTMKNITREQINSLSIPLPSYAEQQSIVTLVERLLQQVNRLEAENKQQQEEVGRLMQAVLREAFVINNKFQEEF
ncbi:hypothetical protein DYU11_29800 [Fibrisoma montanum]|uniref:Type I restriction modification DNA specificity domain-containing protein n=1 Tax=Fibrisoma montanum TaxID=2305895 RepID=A0A418LXR2_9BACT|nr:restriction endonuclease subunit S [Fibrisoma montanum]RIV18149.1 hypothetical protein DYU11_29800 [Fibrisoma montanum]